MTPADRAFAGDVAAAFAGFVTLVGAVVLLIDGAEQARDLASGAMSASQWARWVLARWPGAVAGMLPVAAALAAAFVASRWQRLGLFDALESAGVRPMRLAFVAGTVGAVGVILGLCLREVVAGAAIAVTAPTNAWIAVEGGGDRVMVRARRLDGDRVDGLDGALRDAGRITAFRADVAEFGGGRWEVGGAEGLSAAQIASALPTPSDWRALAAGPGADAPVGTLWRLRGSPAGAAWLLESGVRVAYGGGFALVAVGLARSPRGGMAVVGVALGWRVLQSAAIAAAAGGAWATSTAAWVPLAVVCAAIGVSLRSSCGRSSPTG